MFCAHLKCRALLNSNRQCAQKISPLNSNRKCAQNISHLNSNRQCAQNITGSSSLVSSSPTSHAPTYSPVQLSARPTLPTISAPLVTEYPVAASSYPTSAPLLSVQASSGSAFGDFTVPLLISLVFCFLLVILGVVIWRCCTQQERRRKKLKAQVMAISLVK